MKKNLLLFLLVLVSALFLQSCARDSNDVWEDTKSAGRHVKRGVRALGGKHGDSRQIRSRQDFECSEEDSEFCPTNEFESTEYQNQYGQNEEFIPLQDQFNDEIAMVNMQAPPPRETPGEIGSSLPTIQSFKDPNTIPQMCGLFYPIYFEYNSNLIKGSQNLQTIHRIGDYLRSHANVYVFIEGHTDERGPQAYNLALGARRSNAVRNLLINEGVNPDNLFTISYGKERPVVLEHHEESWAKNRRSEFKVYVR
jgi:peptidoglycan-associated lipoprotein